jgi:hypothetical protein
VATYPVLEHREHRTSRWLRENRLRVAVLVALLETLLVVASLVQWKWVVVGAGIVFVFHLFVGRRARWDSLRQLSWAAAVSQTLPVLLPLVAVVIGTLLVLAVLIAAVVILALVILGRR